MEIEEVSIIRFTLQNSIEDTVCQWTPLKKLEGGGKIDKYNCHGSVFKSYQ